MTSWTVFDYGCVLSLPQPATDFAALAARAGAAPDDFALGYWKLRVGYDRGDLEPRPYWSAVLGRPVDAALAGELDRLDIISWVHANADTFAVVERLAAGGANLALLSNTPESLASAMDHASWAALFPRRFYSCRIREVKPDAAIFQHVLDELGTTAAETTFIDDRLENVDAARALGIRALHFTSADELQL